MHTHTHTHTQNVFVVNAQPTAAPTVILTQQAHAPDYLILTIVGFQLCFFFGGILGMALLIPALICSIMVGSTTQLGWYGKCFSSSHYSPFSSLSHVLTSCVNTISPFIPSSFHARTRKHTHTQAQNANKSGDYDTAKRLGRFSLGWNIGVYIFYALVTVGWIIGIAVWISSLTSRVRTFG